MNDFSRNPRILSEYRFVVRRRLKPSGMTGPRSTLFNAPFRPPVPPCTHEDDMRAVIPPAILQSCSRSSSIFDGGR
jgi:hypothetical protein